MDKSDAPTLLVPLLALLAILFPFAVSVRSPVFPAEKSPQAKQPINQQRERKTATGLPPHSAASLIEDFLHARSDRKSGWAHTDRRDKYSLDFMIATVPDPVDSRLPYIFDTFIDSMQRAFEAAGYGLDRFHLVWSEPPPTAADTQAAKQPDNTPRYRWVPSLLLFRKWDKVNHKGELVLVFLVGETPTSGLHKAAMASALRQLDQFFPGGPGYKQLPDELHDLKLASSEIKIMGPTFSGSADSLDFALRDWLAKNHRQLAQLDEPPITVRIISGTATAINPEEFSQIGSGDRVAFEAVVPPDSKTVPSILSYIWKLGELGNRSPGYRRIAMLSEANTAYGQNLKSSLEASHTQLKDMVLLNLPFPLHISQLRTASEKQRLSQQQSTSPPITNPTPTIPIEEGQSTQPKETPPAFSNLEVSSAELVLSRLLSTISREGYRAVGILATDVRDTMFLAREIHVHCPGTLVFTVNSDLLYMHPDVSTSTRGMLVFTPYPLFNLNQVWTPPFGGRQSRLQFPNQAAEGVYNATLALLDQQWQMLDYGRPFLSQEPKHPAQPALWVTVMGRNGPLPVGLLDWATDSSHQYSLVRKTQSKPERIDWSGIYTANSAVGIVLLGAVLFALSLLVIRQYYSPASLQRERRLYWVSRLFDEPVTSEYRPQSRIFLLACLVGPLSFYVVVAAAYFLPAIASYRVDAIFNITGWRWLVVLALAAGLLSLAGAAIVVLFAFWKGHRQKSLLQCLVIIVVFLGCAFVLFLSARLADVWLLKKPSEAIFTYVRAFDFSSGLSPLVPLFCLVLAGFLWAFCAFWRLRMIDGMRPKGGENRGKKCLLRANTPSFKGVITLEIRVRERLEKASAFSIGWYIGLIFVGWVVAMYLFFSPFVPSYEGIPFYFLFGWGFFLVYAALTTEFGRLCLVWGALRRLLQRLGQHPMQAAYGRYRQSFPGLSRIDLAIPQQTWAVLSFSVDQAERLLRLAPSPFSSTARHGTVVKNLERWVPQAQLAIEAATENLANALKYNAMGKWRLAIENRSQSQQALGKLAQMTAELLEPSWRAMTTPPYKETPEFRAFRELGEEFLAGRAVLLISYVLPALRNLGAFILSGLLLMLFSVVSYPFLQRNHFLVFNWIVILSFVAMVLVVMLQMERDPVLSALNGTKPGQVTLTRHFAFRVLTYVMIPLLALLGAQFPDTVGRIVSWFSSTPGH